MSDVLDHLADALALQRQGRLAEAEAGYRAVLSAEPEQAIALHLLGLLTLQAGRAVEAAALLREAARLRPGDADTSLALARACAESGDLAEAEALYRATLQREPSHRVALAGLATALLRAGRPAEAFAVAGRAVEAGPEWAEAWFLRGTAARALGRPAEAAEALRCAVALAPAHAAAWLNLGNAMADLDNLAAAEAHLRRAIACDPASAEAHSGLGVVLTAVGRLGDAVAACDAAIALQPDFAPAYWNRSFAHLLAGDFTQGFRDYEWRRRRPGHARACLPGAEWRGEDLAGRTLLVHGEQGLGDAIQFARYLPLLAASAGQVVLACAAPLAPLLEQLPVRVVPRDGPYPAADFHVDQMSLPLLLGTEPHRIPAAAGYLRADRRRAAAIRAGLPDGRRVGIVWSGNPAHGNDMRRSMPTAALAPVLAADACFVSLQVGPRAPEITRLFGLPDHAARLTDFAETAAWVETLDLVIAVDTSTAHLAGAMGRPVWVMLPYAPDWRWMTGRADSPWYASMRLFRQSAPGDWPGVTAAVAEALRG
ncbi:MAG TPA: tetratricopeptide repeat-containing glycosyltransferase family protein [Acetobacteraceae bacterium]